MMFRLMMAAGAAAWLLASPAVAATNQQKMETCNFGADEQKLTGSARKSYMAKCMSNKDSPRGKPIGAPAGAPKP